MPFCFFGGLADEFRRGTLLCGQGFSLALSFPCQAGYVPLVDPHLSCLNDGLPRGLPCENGRIIQCRACPEPGECGLPCFGNCLKTINKLVCFELSHEHSLCAPRLSRVARNR